MLDLAIIGSGAAGVAALEARARGARVAVIEAGEIGGTCVNVPSKILLRAGEEAHRAARVRSGAVEVDFAELAGARNRLIGTLCQAKYAEVHAAAGVELIRGRARFLDPSKLAVNGEPIQARAYLLATGAQPQLPPIPGLEESRPRTYLEATTSEVRPESLLVIGGGAVGLELAQAYHRPGSRVTVLEAAPRVLPSEDEELARALSGYLKEEGIAIQTGVRVERVEGGNGFRVHTDAGAFEAEQLLVATGRRPRLADLNLEAVGIACDERGFLRVEDRLATSNPGVHAAGDAAGLPQFVYVAAQSGRVAVRNALGASERLDLSAVPPVTFTDPALTAVGLIEAEARSRERNVRVARLDLAELPRALAVFDTRGFFKIVVSASGAVLGLHVLAPDAGDALQDGVLAVKHGLSYRVLSETFHPYLTLAEGVRLVAQALDTDVKRLSCCA